RDWGATDLVAKGQRQRRLGAVAPRFAAVDVADLAEAIAQHGAITLVAGGRIEIDDVVIVAGDHDLDAVEDGALAGAGRADHGDHAADVEIERLEDVPVVEGEAGELVHQAYPSGCAVASAPDEPAASCFGASASSRRSPVQAKKSPGLPRSIQRVREAANS